MPKQWQFPKESRGFFLRTGPTRVLQNLKKPDYPSRSPDTGHELNGFGVCLQGFGIVLTLIFHCCYIIPSS